MIHSVVVVMYDTQCCSGDVRYSVVVEMYNTQCGSGDVRYTVL